MEHGWTHMNTDAATVIAFSRLKSGGTDVRSVMHAF